jgi:hypothetical protein
VIEARRAEQDAKKARSAGHERRLERPLDDRRAALGLLESAHHDAQLVVVAGKRTERERKREPSLCPEREGTGRAVLHEVAVETTGFEADDARSHRAVAIDENERLRDVRRAAEQQRDER